MILTLVTVSGDHEDGSAGYEKWGTGFSDTLEIMSFACSLYHIEIDKNWVVYN